MVAQAGQYSLSHDAQAGDFFHRAQCHRFARHTVDDAARFVLRQRGRTGLTHLQHTGCAIATHAGQQYTHGITSGHGGCRIEQYIDRRTVAIDRRALDEFDHVVGTAASQLHVPLATRRQINVTG